MRNDGTFIGVACSLDSREEFAGFVFSRYPLFYTEVNEFHNESYVGACIEEV